MLDRLHRSDEALVGKKVLVVDDDVRDILRSAAYSNGEECLY